MASLDILHPLSGDHVQAGTLSVLVAYDFGTFYKDTHVIVCTLYLNDSPVGKPIEKTVTTRADTVTFDFPDVAAGRYYKVEVKTDAIGTDYEDQIEVEAQPIAIIRDVSPITFAAAGPGAAANKKYAVTGKHRGLTMTTHHVHVLVYELKPGKGHRPFNDKWREAGMGLEFEADFTSNTDWKAEVTANHTKHIHCRIKVYKVEGGRLTDLKLPNSRGRKA